MSFTLKDIQDLLDERDYPGSQPTPDVQPTSGGKNIGIGGHNYSSIQDFYKQNYYNQPAQQIMQERQPAPPRDYLLGQVTRPFGPITGFDEGRYRQPGDTYWQNPQTIARWRNAIHSLPVGSPAPSWVDKDLVEFAYEYYNQMYQGTPYYLWAAAMHIEDPMRNVFKDLPAPPSSYLLDSETAYLGEAQRTDAAIFKDVVDSGQVYPPGTQVNEAGEVYMPGSETNEFGYTPEQWEGMEGWERGLVQGMANSSIAAAAQGTVLGGLRGGWMGALSGLLAGTFLGTLVNGEAEKEARSAAGESVSVITGYGRMMGDETKQKEYEQGTYKSPILSVLRFMDAGALPIERGMGLIVQLADSIQTGAILNPQDNRYDSFEEFMQFMNAAYKAGDVTYDVLTSSNLTSVTGYERMMGKELPADENEAYLKAYRIGIDEPMITPLEGEGTAMVRMIDQVRNAILEEGMTPQEVNILMQQTTGLGGQMTDLAGHIFLDLLNIKPDIESYGAMKAIKLTNDAADVKKAADMAADVNVKGGALRYMQIYGAELRKLPSEQLAELGPISRYFAGVDEAGKLNLLKARAEGTKNITHLWQLTNQSQALEVSVLFADSTMRLLDQYDDPGIIVKTINGIAQGDPELYGAASRLVPWIKSAEGEVYPLALRDYKIDELILEQWYATRPKMNMLQEVADVLKKDPRDIVGRIDAGDAAKVLEEYKVLKGGEIDLRVEDLEDIANLVTKDMVAITVDEFKGQIFVSMVRHMDDWAAKYFKVTPDAGWVRFSNLTKSAQSFLVLGGNPITAANNFLDNVTTLAWDGLLGFRTPKSIDEFWDKKGITLARLQQGFTGYDVGTEAVAGVAKGVQVGGEIIKAKKVPLLKRTLVDRAQGFFQSDTVKKIQFATKWMGAIEESSGKQALTEGFSQAWQNWQMGKWNDPLPVALEAELRRINPELPGFVQDTIRTANRPQEIDRIWTGMERKTIESLASTVANDVGLPEESVRTFMDTFIAPEYRKRLEKATTDAEYRSAVIDLRTDINKRINEMVESQVEKIAEGTAEKTRLEGATSGYQELGEVIIDIETFWTKHSTDWGLVNDRIVGLSREDASRIVRAQDTVTSMEWKRTKDIADAKVRGVIRGMGADDPTIQRLENSLINQRQIWDVFFREQKKARNAYFDEISVNKKLTADERSAMWEAYEIEQNKAATLTYEAEIDLQMEIDEIYVEVFEKQFDGGGKIAESWRSDVLDVRKKMRDAQSTHRDDLVGMSGAARRKAWKTFEKDTWNPLIKELGEVSLEGIRKFYEDFKPEDSIGKSGIVRKSIPEFWSLVEQSEITSPAEWRATYKILNRLLDPGDVPFTRLDCYRTLSVEEYAKLEKVIGRLDDLRKQAEAPKPPEGPPKPTGEIAEFVEGKQAKPQEETAEWTNPHKERWGENQPSNDDALKDSEFAEANDKANDVQGKLSDRIFKGDEEAQKMWDDAESIRVAETEEIAKGMTDEELYHELISMNRDNVLEGRALRTDRKDAAANELIRRYPELEIETIKPPEDLPDPGLTTKPQEPAQVQFMITNKMKSQLGGLGYSEAQIARMIPEEAARIIGEQRTRPSINLASATDKDVEAIGFTHSFHAMNAVNKALGTEYKTPADVPWEEVLQVARQRYTDQPELIDTGTGKALDHYESIVNRLYASEQPLPEEISKTISKVQAQQEIIIHAGRGRIVSAEPQQIRGFFREAALELMVESPKQVDGVMGLMDAKARMYGLQNGVEDSEWWIQRVRGIREADPDLTPKEVIAKAFVEIKDGKSLIHALEMSDVSSLAHEVGHMFRRDLQIDDINIFRTWLKNTHNVDIEYDATTGRFIDTPEKVTFQGVEYGKAEYAEEMFARGWEQYLREGIAPTAGLQKIFSMFSEWLRVVYKTLAGSDVDVKIDDNMRGIYDRLLSETPIERITLENVEYGNRTFALVPGEDKYWFRYGLVELDDLVTSHLNTGDPNPRYYSVLQERLRDRAASQIQIGDISQNLDVDEVLTDFHVLGRGPSKVGVDGMVEDGNGRILAIMMARDMFPEKYQKYQDTLKSQLDTYGIDPKTYENYDNPGLVLIRETDVDRAKFAALANDPTGLGMSAVELANKYKKVLSDEHLSAFHVGENLSAIDSLKLAENREMVSDFIGKLPKNASKKLLDKNGNVSLEGYRVMQYALFAKAYPGDAGMRLLAQIAETQDVAMKNIENAMMRSLGSSIRLEAGIEAGKYAPELSITEDIAAAVDMYMRLKQNDMSVQMYVGNLKAFGEELTPIQLEILRFADDHKRSAKPFAELINRYTEQVMEMPDQRQQGLDLGVELPERAGKDDYVRGIIGSIEKEIADEKAARAAARAAKQAKAIGNQAIGETGETAAKIAEIGKDPGLPLEGTKLEEPDSPGPPTGATDEGPEYYNQIINLAGLWTASGRANADEVVELFRKVYGDVDDPRRPRMLSAAEAEMESQHIINLAENEKDIFLADILDTAKQIEGVKYPEGVEGFTVKGQEMMVGELMEGQQITDSLRTILVVEDMDKIEPALAHLYEKGYETYINPYWTEKTPYGRLRVKPTEDITNLYQGSDSAYKHISIKLVQGQNDPIIKELQLMTPNIWEVEKKTLGMPVPGEPIFESFQTALSSTFDKYSDLDLSPYDLTPEDLLFQRGKAPADMMPTFFDETAEDTPLFSGTAQKAQGELFAPKEEGNKQLSMFSAEPGIEEGGRMIVLRIAGAGVNEQTVIPFGNAGEHIPQLEKLMTEYPDAAFSYQIKSADGNSVYKTGRNVEDLMPKGMKGQPELFAQRFKQIENDQPNKKFFDDIVRVDLKSFFEREYTSFDETMGNHGILTPSGKSINVIQGGGVDVLGKTINGSEFYAGGESPLDHGGIYFSFDMGYDYQKRGMGELEPYINKKVVSLKMPGVPTKAQEAAIKTWIDTNDPDMVLVHYHGYDSLALPKQPNYSQFLKGAEPKESSIMDKIIAAVKNKEYEAEKYELPDVYYQRYTFGEAKQKMADWFQEYEEEGYDISESWFGEWDDPASFNRGFIGLEGELFATSGMEDHGWFFGGEAQDMGLIRYYSDSGYALFDTNIDTFGYEQYKAIEDILYAKKLGDQPIRDIRFEVERTYEPKDLDGLDTGEKIRKIQSRYEFIDIEIDEMTDIDDVISQMKQFRDKIKARWGTQDAEYYSQRNPDSVRIDHITDQDAEHGGMRIVANVFKDDKLLAYLPERYDVLEWQEGAQQSFRILGLDVQDPRYWVIEMEDGGIQRMPKDGVELPAAVNAPPGTMESISPAPVSTAEVVAEGYTSMVDPVLNSLSTHMQDPDNKYPQSVMNLDTKLDPETANQLKGYLQQTKSQMSEAKNTASTSAQMRRDFSLHNYNKRYGFDQYLGFPYPYEFFYTRAMSKWGLRILERPNILKNYALMRSIGNNYAKGYPTRLKGKVPMKFPYMPEGGGDYMFVDPLKKANPWVNMFLRPMEVLTKDKNMTEKRASSIIYEQMREGSITEEAGTTIIDEKKGDEWDRAMEIASAEIDSDISNPYEMINTIISPNIFIDWIYKGMTGQKEKISQLPFTRLVQNATAALGVGPEGGINLEGGIRKTLGMPEVDRFYDFKVDAQLAYMAADKLITADEAEAAMMNRSDQNYILAQEMAGKISAVRYPFSMFGADVYPSGELRQRNLMDDYAHMWDEIHLGNEGAYDEFFEEYPEYAAWQNRFKEPEERLRDHLVDEIWNRWIELPSPAKKEAEQLFGDKFQNSFLETETRSYDSFTAEELAWYASQLGAEMPETSPDITDVTQETPQILNLPEIPPESKSAMDAYYEEVDTLFPNLNNEFDVINALPDGPDKEAIKRKTSINDFYKHKSKFLADHPELAPLMDSNMKDVVGMPQEIQEYMANYVEMKHTMFPNIDQIQYDYWSVEGYREKKEYRAKFPQLSNYWEFNRWSASQFPEAAPYILSNMTISKALFPDAKYGEFDAGAIMNEFDPQFLSPGLNDILEEHFLMGKSIPEGALSELELIWEKMGSPGTFNKFVEATRMYY